MSANYDVMELRARVSELEAKVEFLYKHLNVQYVKQMSEANRKVAEVLQTGNVLEAIRVYRELHGVDLASAKAAVEEIKSRLRL